MALKIKEIQDFLKEGVGYCTRNPAGWSWKDYNSYIRFVIAREAGFDEKEDDGIYQIGGDRLCVGLRAVDKQYFVEDSEILGDSCSLSAEDAESEFKKVAEWLMCEAKAYMKAWNSTQKQYCPECGARLFLPHWAGIEQCLMYCPECCKSYDKI